MESMMVVSRQTTIDKKTMGGLIHYAQCRLCDEVSPNCTYHNYDHTRNVVKVAADIGMSMHLGELDLQLVQIAAWFHDLGFIDGPEDHEVRSVFLVNDRLHQIGLAEEHIKAVDDAILSTKLNRPPINLLGEILKDADTSHLAFDDYPMYEKLLRREMWLAMGKSYDDKAWNALNIDFFQAHEYYTTYGQVVLEEGKRRNLDLVLERRFN